MKCASGTKIRISISKIPKAGKGLFANCDLAKGEHICFYSGRLVDVVDAAYEDPTYLVSFENGRGFKLVGDDLEGDVGHFANSVHPLNKKVKQNAKFDFRHKKMTSNERGKFEIVACRDIKKSEEIIVNYGSGYWLTMNRYFSNHSGLPREKPQSMLERDQRALKRRRSCSFPAQSV
jgi:hypothetical protein